MLVVSSCSDPHIEPLSPLPDINECTNKTVCGDHAFCQNLIGTYLCVCDMGFTTTADGKACVGIHIFKAEQNVTLCSGCLSSASGGEAPPCG
uniref:EGF-like domain-containing protein n=1 Tax=Seriola lalandi dorsalis TaxID=1841481 RepID=A0A3B4WBS5_SERLL